MNPAYGRSTQAADYSNRENASLYLSSDLYRRINAGQVGRPTGHRILQMTLDNLARIGRGCPPYQPIEPPAIIQGQLVGDAANLNFVAGVGISVQIVGNFFFEDQFVVDQLRFHWSSVHEHGPLL